MTLEIEAPGGSRAPRPPRAQRSAGWRLGVAVLPLCLLLCGCKVVILSGPTTAAIGDTVVFELEVSSDTFGFDPVPIVVADVPMGWEYVASGFAGTVAGAPVSGNGEAFESAACDFGLGAVRPGFQRWHLRPETTIDALPAAGSAVATVEFLVTDQPSGSYDVYFVFGSTEDCSPPAGATMNRGASFLTLVQALFDDTGGIDGLGGPGDVESSPDGQHVYVAGGLDSSVAAFSRDPASNTLTLIGTSVNGAAGVAGMAVPRGLAASPDGQHLYVASLSNPDTGDQGGIAFFARDSTTGELTFVERLLEDAQYLETSPDGRYLYASSDGVTVYSRNEASGELTFVQSVFPGGQLLMSPDGANLYVSYFAGAPVIDVHARDDVSGQLTYQQFYAGGDAVALSPDGRHLYWVRETSIDVNVYERDETTGSLSFGVTSPIGLPFSIAPGSVAVSPEGSHVIVGGRRAVVVLQRNRVTGGLTYVESHYAFNLPSTELEGPRALAFAPGGRQLYASSLMDDAVLVFDTAILFRDGFESGTTSAWTATVP